MKLKHRGIMAITIRPAQALDLDFIVSELKVFSSVYGSKLNLFGDEDYVRFCLETVIQSHLCLMAVDEHGERLGFISGLVKPHLYNPEIKVLSETFWWVSKAYRGSKAAVLLLNAFTQWGREHCHWITLQIREKTELKDRSLAKHGYRRIEKSFLLEVR